MVILKLVNKFKFSIQPFENKLFLGLSLAVINFLRTASPGDSQLLSLLIYDYKRLRRSIIVNRDIPDETDLKLPYKTMVAGEEVYNKIEGMSRLTMIDLRNRL